VDNVKMDLTKIRWVGVVQDIDKWRALVNAVL
jgi:hypothetical protein